MDGYRILPEAEYRELQKLAERASAIMANAGELKLPPSATAAHANGSEPEETPNSEDHVGAEGRYRIARGAWSYADVVDREVERDVFSLDHACETILPLIKTKNKRPRDSLRTALDRDDRYQRVSDRDGVWWRRVGHRSESDATTESNQLSPLTS